uniref:ATP-grasp enzyme n=1 Tax=Scolopendra viridis TaxID=118503 RepID=A0A4D5RAZ1_SCOVI
MVKEDSSYDKWRIILSLVVYILAIQWIFLFPVVLVLLVYSFIHRKLKIVVNKIISVFRKSSQPKQQRTVLLNGCTQAVALHIARLLNVSGHRVVACDYPVNWLNSTRFSQAIDAYYTVPNPRRGVQDYIRTLCDIAEKENVDLFIPIPRIEDLMFDLFTKAPLERQGCRVFSMHPWNRQLLFPSDNNKVMNNININNNNCFDRVDTINNNNEDGDIEKHKVEIENRKNWKKIIRRDSNGKRNGEIRDKVDKMFRDSFESICENISDLSALMYCGEKFSSTCFVKEGNVIAIGSCSYASNTSSESKDFVHEQVLIWAKAMLKQLEPKNQSGALTFESIATPEGNIFPYSCNPHIGMGALTFWPQDDFINCFVQPEVSLPSKPYQLQTGAQRYCIYPELWKVLKKPTLDHSKLFLKHVWQSKEAFFDFADPLPFFIHYHLHLPFLMAFETVRRKTWTHTDFLNGKLLGC